MNVHNQFLSPESDDEKKKVKIAKGEIEEEPGNFFVVPKYYY